MKTHNLGARLLSILFLALIGANEAALGDTRTYQATTDFPVIDAGAVPYYSEAPDRPSLAINAAIEEYRDVFARAEVVYDGLEGQHDITLVALAELDGEADYRILVNNVVVGEASNPEVTVDYTVIRHTFENIAIPAGATIAVESLANTNGKIPEGDGTAFARGRWTALELLEVTDDETVQTPTNIDLSITINSSKATILPNEAFDIELQVQNADDSITATQPVVTLTIDLEHIDVISAEQCSENQQGLRCIFPEIAENTSRTMAVSLRSTDESIQLNIQAVAQADQQDRDESNNAASTSISIASESPVTEPNTDSTTTTEEETADKVNTGGLSMFGLCFLLLLSFRKLTSRATLIISFIHSTKRDT